MATRMFTAHTSRLRHSNLLASDSWRIHSLLGLHIHLNFCCYLFLLLFFFLLYPTQDSWVLDILSFSKFWPPTLSASTTLSYLNIVKYDIYRPPTFLITFVPVKVSQKSNSFDKSLSSSGEILSGFNQVSSEILSFQSNCELPKQLFGLLDHTRHQSRFQSRKQQPFSNTIPIILES